MPRAARWPGAALARKLALEGGGRRLVLDDDSHRAAGDCGPSASRRFSRRPVPDDLLDCLEDGPHYMLVAGLAVGHPIAGIAICWRRVPRAIDERIAQVGEQPVDRAQGRVADQCRGNAPPGTHR